MATRNPLFSNFPHLQVCDSQLVRLRALAEKYLVDDPNTCLLKISQFGELLAKAFRGELVEQNAEDESAKELLEMVMKGRIEVQPKVRREKRG